jgi:hypothetical protein
MFILKRFNRDNAVTMRLTFQNHQDALNHFSAVSGRLVPGESACLSGDDVRLPLWAGDF